MIAAHQNEYEVETGFHAEVNIRDSIAINPELACEEAVRHLHAPVDLKADPSAGDYWSDHRVYTQRDMDSRKRNASLSCIRHLLNEDGTPREDELRVIFDFAGITHDPTNKQYVYLSAVTGAVYYPGGQDANQYFPTSDELILSLCPDGGLPVVVGYYRPEQNIGITGGEVSELHCGTYTFDQAAYDAFHAE